MPIRIALISDFHLGMSFANYPDAVRSRLVEARFSCLERSVALAGAEKCDLLVVAGDLFDRVSMPKRDVLRAAQALKGFQGRLAAVLPGNHDYFALDDELWTRFREACGDAVLFLGEPRAYPLKSHDIDACLYPAPCVTKHSKANAVGWVHSAARDASIGHHIGVAHGSLEGMSPDFNGDYYPMKQAQLLETGMEAWLLGHTHVPFPQVPAGERFFNAGTPEPDGFDCAHEGSAWILDIGDDRTISARQKRTGGLRFVDESRELRNRSDLDRLEQLAGPEAGATLLRLRLAGRLPRDLFPELERLRDGLSRKMLHLEWRTDQLREQITAEDIDRDFPEGSFPHELLSRLAQDDDPEALQIAHELLGEASR